MLVFIAMLSYIGLTIMISMYAEEFSFLNPIRNYKKWTTINWFGVTLLTLMLNILLFPYAMTYWTYKCFTIGRNNNNNNHNNNNNNN